MANGSSGNSRGMEIRARNWDDPDGLGWQLWRRAQSTGLSTRSIQRDLARIRSNLLRSPLSLASEIRRRWAAGTIAAGVDGDLPLVLKRFAFYPGSASPQHATPGLRSTRNIANAPTLSLAYAIPRSPQAAAGSWAAAAGVRQTVKAPEGQIAGASDDASANPAARRAVALSASASQKQSARIGPGGTGALTSTLLDRILRRRAPLAATYPLDSDRVPMPLSSVVGERHNPPRASLHRANVNASMTESPSPSTMLPPTVEASAPFLPAARAGVSRKSAQSLSGAVMQPAEYQPAQARSGTVQLGRPAGTGGERISRDFSATTVAAPTTMNRAATIGIDQAKSGTEWQAADAEISLKVPFTDTHASVYEPASERQNDLSVNSTAALARETTMPRRGGSETAIGTPQILLRTGPMMGVIARSPEVPRLPLGLQALKRVRTAPMSGPFAADFGFQSGAPGTFPRLIGRTLSFIPRIEPTDRAREIGVGDSAASRRGGLIEGNSLRSELRQTGNGPDVRSSTVAGRPSGGSQQAQTIGPPIVKVSTDRVQKKSNQSIVLRFASGGASQPMTAVTAPLSARVSERPVLPAATEAGRSIDFSRAGGALGVAARNTAITSRLTAMPLSIAPVFKRGHSMAGTGDQRSFPQRANTLAPKTARAEYQGLSRIDAAIIGGESGAGTAAASGGGSQALRRREVADNNPVMSPLLSRAATQTTLDFIHLTRTSGITSSPGSHSGEVAVTSDYHNSRAQAGIYRAAADAGFGTIHRFDFGENLRGWLPLHQVGFSSGSVARAGSSIQRAAGRRAAPLSIPGSSGMRASRGDQLPGGKTESQLILPTEPFPIGVIPAVTAVESSEFHARTAGPRPVLAPMRAIAITPTALLRRFDVSTYGQRRALAPAMRGATPEMPFAVMRDGRNPAALHNGNSLQAAPQQTAPAANRLVPIGVGAESGPVESPEAVSKPQTDLDELVEKAWRKLMRKLTIERERRGYTPWQ